MAHFEQWAGFKGKEWVNSVDVRSFIQENYTPYEGDESFLEGPTEATDTLWGKLQELQKEERAKGGVLDMETEVVSGLTAYGPGYISLCHTVELRWLSRLVQLTVISQAKNFIRSLQNIIKHTTREYLIFTHLK